MNRIGVMEFVWQRLKRLPRSVWIAGGFALLLIPALLLWLVFALVGGAWQAGGSLFGQGRELLQSALPAEVQKLATELPADGALQALQSEAQQRLQAEVDRVQASLPLAAEALPAALPAMSEGLRQVAEQGRAGADQALAAFLGPQRSVDVGGEDPSGIVRLPGFVRTAFAREGEILKVSWSGPAPHAQVVAFYTEQLKAAGYQATVLKAEANAEVVSFESAQRRLQLDARADGRGGSELHWEAR